MLNPRHAVEEVTDNSCGCWPQKEGKTAETGLPLDCSATIALIECKERTKKRKEERGEDCWSSRTDGTRRGQALARQ